MGHGEAYKTFSQTEEKEKRARELFPNSIMLRTSYDIDELNINKLTAWLIGWNDKPENWYDWFREKSKF